MIACLGWGSLIWEPRSLKLKSEWFENGASLPIEFTRISNDGRVTLIVDSEAKPVVTLWAQMNCDSLDDAIDSLRERENCARTRIHSTADKVMCAEEVKKWTMKNGFDYAIWTGLSYSRKTNFNRPNKDEIITHLKDLPNDVKIRAEEYIRKAPRQIDTEYRRAIVAEFDWSPF